MPYAHRHPLFSIWVGADKVYYHCAPRAVTRRWHVLGPLLSTSPTRLCHVRWPSHMRGGLSSHEGTCSRCLCSWLLVTDLPPPPALFSPFHQLVHGTQAKKPLHLALSKLDSENAACFALKFFAKVHFFLFPELPRTLHVSASEGPSLPFFPCPV